jgi:16S rRNA (guanine966-N2)-methyltransferase
MRIIAGEFRGRRLRAPKGRTTRPTPDRVRVALFSILGERVVDARVAELFAGTGSLGLESLSRGAAFALFTERDRAALACLAENVAALGVAHRCRILPRSAFDLPRLWRDEPPFDLVFCDPPFRFFAEAAARRRLEALLDALPLSAGARVVVENPAGRTGDFAPTRLLLVDERRWGTTGMAFYGPAPGKSALSDSR